MKLRGNSVQTRWIMSLHSRDQSSLVAASPMWCAMPEARGEKIVTSVPRSRWMRSCAPSMLARIASSLILGSVSAAVRAASPNAATCWMRNASSGFGAVV